MVALDAKDGKVAVEGWSKLTGHDVIDLAKRFQDYGVEAIIHTDIGRDGMLSGLNMEASLQLARALSVPVIASGGITNLDDVRALCASSKRASSAPSPVARSIRARSTSRKLRSSPTSSPKRVRPRTKAAARTYRAIGLQHVIHPFTTFIHESGKASHSLFGRHGGRVVKGVNFVGCAMPAIRSRLRAATMSRVPMSCASSTSPRARTNAI
jgi:hypothetical protein